MSYSMFHVTWTTFKFKRNELGTVSAYVIKTDAEFSAKFGILLTRHTGVTDLTYVRSNFHGTV